MIYDCVVIIVNPTCQNIKLWNVDGKCLYCYIIKKSHA